MCLVYAWLNSQLKSKIGLLDRGSIRSSPDRLRISAGLFLHVLVYMGEKVDLHLVHPALNLSILDAGILIMVQQIRLMMVSLNRVDHSKMFLLFEFCCGSTPSCLKVKGLGPGLDTIHLLTEVTIDFIMSHCIA